LYTFLLGEGFLKLRIYMAEIAVFVCIVYILYKQKKIMSHYGLIKI